MIITKYKVRFYDADPAGILFFANYFRIAHMVYEEFMTSLKSTINYFDNEKFILPIVHTSADYLKPVYVNDELEIILTVEEIKESSFILKYKMCGAENVIKAVLKTVHVCVDKKTFAKEKISGNLKTKLTAHLYP